MNLFINICFFSFTGFLVGAQFARYVDIEVKIKHNEVKKAPSKYWLSYLLTIAFILLLAMVGSEFGVFEKSKYGLAGDLAPILFGILSLYPSYILVKRKLKNEAI